MLSRFLTKLRTKIVPLGVLLTVMGISTIGTAALTAQPAHAAKPQPTATTACNPKVQKCSGSVTPQFLINPGATGEYAHGKTSESNCNGNLYVAWTGADDAVNIAWGSTGGAFAHKVTFNERAYYNLGTGSLPALYTSPSLTCWAPAYGPYAGVYQVWMAWTGTDQNLYFGYFDGNPSHNYLYDRSTVPNQKSYFSPTIAAFGGTIRYAWVGENDGTQGYHSGYPNFIRSDDGISWYSQNTWRAETAVGGMGFTSYCQPGGRLQSVVCLGRHR